jgi:hypothetical protein
VFSVDKAGSNSYLTTFGPGLTYGSAGEPCTFTVVTKDGGFGAFYGVTNVFIKS